jgi:class 3 adenylate cyclase
LEHLGLMEDLAQALTVLGELHLKNGSLKEAAQALRRARSLGAPAGPELVRLRLQEGKPGEALTLAMAALDRAAQPITRTRILPALIESALAAGDVGAAREAVDHLEREKANLSGPVGEAEWLLALGRVTLAEGKPNEAIEPLQRAVKVWRHEVKAPYEAALAQSALAAALHRSARGSSALIEAESALDVFKDLRARIDEQDASRLIQEIAPAERMEIPAASVCRTFLFTDLVGSTQLIESIGDEHWNTLLDWHNRTLDHHFAAHNGTVVNHTGDGFFVCFPEAQDAVGCALAIQKDLAAHRLEAGFAPRVRIGLHTGEAMESGETMRGREVHIAARVGAIAEADEIVASRSSVQDLDGNFHLHDRGEVRLKGIAEPVALVSIRPN